METVTVNSKTEDTTQIYQGCRIRLTIRKLIETKTDTELEDLF
jgi:hypothetical protein